MLGRRAMTWAKGRWRGAACLVATAGLAVPSASAQTGPLVNFFGPASLAGVPLHCADMIENTPVCSLANGTSFYLVVEGRPGSSPVGSSTFNPGGLPDLQIQVDKALGNGSSAVCDDQAPSIGGVAPVSPPDLTFSDPGPVNDFACRFSTENCTVDPFGEPRFLVPSSTIQFCATIGAAIGFAPGDTRVTLRLRGTDGSVSAVRQLIVRVGGATPTFTRTPSPGPTGGASATPTRTATSAPSATAEAMPTVTRTASPPGTPTTTPTSASGTTSTPTPTVNVSPTTSLASRTPTPFIDRPRCVGDCDGMGSVDLEEVEVGTSIALDLLPLATCPSFDTDMDDRVSVEELVTAVLHMLDSCPL